MSAYIGTDGVLVYADPDSVRKCLPYNSTCTSSYAPSACGESFFIGRSWIGWWGWGNGWGYYGDNLTYLYSEIDAPEWAYCADYYYGWWGTFRDCNLNGGDCEMTNTDCGHPRIKTCKRYSCIGYLIDDCSLINGKDKEQRCCAKPNGFKCEEGECDYTFSIVKKEYSVEYERVSGGGQCEDNKSFYENYPESSCGTNPPVYNDTCVEYVYGCYPPNPCNETQCIEPLGKEGWKKEGDEPSNWYGWWGYAGVFWRYDKIDCNCKCDDCAECSEYPCNSYGGSSYYPYGWGAWGGYYGGIGSDCCGKPTAICQKQQGDGSDNPWFCSGSACVQLPYGSDESKSMEGPYTTYLSCMQNCNMTDTNNCIEPDINILSQDDCCNKEYINKKLSECEDRGRSYTKSQSITLCTDTAGCGGNAIYNIKREKCTTKTKQCKTQKVDSISGWWTFTIERKGPEKNYFENCLSCGGIDPECAKNPLYQCPKNTEQQLLKKSIKVIPGAGSVLDTATVKLVVVYCKMVTSPCSYSGDSDP